jgi:microsomal dipeptidase-like Zn-dependent dipeptidase
MIDLRPKGKPGSARAFSSLCLMLALLGGTLDSNVLAQPVGPIRDMPRREPLREPLAEPRLQPRSEIELRTTITEHNIRTVDGTRNFVHAARGGPIAVEADRARGVVERFVGAPVSGAAPPDVELEAARAFVAVLQAKPAERVIPGKVMLALSPEEAEWSGALLEAGAIALGRTGRIDDASLDALIAIALGGASRDDLLTRFVLTGGKGIDFTERLTIKDEDILDRMQDLIDRHPLIDVNADCIAKMKAGAAGLANSVASSTRPLIPNLAPLIAVTPNHGRPGAPVTLTGTGWPVTQPAGVMVVFTSNQGKTNLRATVRSWSSTAIAVIAPSGVGAGPVGFMVEPPQTQVDPVGPALAETMERCFGARGAQMGSRFANWVPPKIQTAPPTLQTGGANLFTGGPQINTVAPPAAQKGQTLTITGHEFVSGDRVQFQGVSASATFVSATQLRAFVPTLTGGQQHLHVRTAAEDSSNAVAIQLLPKLASVLPGEAKVGATVRATGSGFQRESVVLFDGVPMTTSFINAETLAFEGQTQKNVPAGGINFPVTVRNPDGKTTAPFLTFKIFPPPPPPLKGWVDLHTHPMIHLAFGGKLVHGAPDIGSLLPTDVHCKNKVRTTSIEDALSDDSPSHAGYNLLHLRCGDNFREMVVHKFQASNHAIQTGAYAKGYPDFDQWPKWNEITHQKMWVEWLQRAHAGGLRVMVALATNNKTLGDAVSGSGDGPTDDKASADLQVKEIDDFVGRHKHFMEVALSAADVDRIVRAGKLAVIIGIEIDNIGNFNSEPFGGMNDADVKIAIKNEIQRLFKNKVRYIFPIHVIDNWFGGTAIYQNGFNTSNLRERGNFWNIECSLASDDITFQYREEQDLLAMIGQQAAAWVKLGLDPLRVSGPGPVCPPATQTNPPKGSGHRNARTPGWMHEFAIREMMRLGMIIDIDHMSQKTADATLNIAETFDYPVLSGHSGIRGLAGGDAENSRTPLQLQRISKLHGMFGLGTDGAHAYDWAQLYQNAVQIMGYMNPNPALATYKPGSIAFGTDLNGLVKGPMPGNEGRGSNDKNKVVYGAAFPKSKTGNKEWDYNTEGVAHYGMMYDFVMHVRHAPSNGYYYEVSGAKLVDNHVFAGAEYFYQMWKLIEAKKAGIPP